MYPSRVKNYKKNLTVDKIRGHQKDLKTLFNGLHTHTFFEAIFIEQGEGVHYIGDQVYPIKPNSLYIIPKGILHYLSPKGDLIGFYWMSEHDPAISTFDFFINRQQWYISLLNMPEISNILENLLHQTTSFSSSNQLVELYNITLSKLLPSCNKDYTKSPSLVHLFFNIIIAYNCPVRILFLKIIVF